MDAIDAIEYVLQEEGRPMHYKDLADAILDRKLWTTQGKTPAATINALITVDIKEKGLASRFKRVERGVVALSRPKSQAKRMASPTTNIQASRSVSTQAARPTANQPRRETIDSIDTLSNRGLAGRTIKLFLVNGTPQGLRTLEIPFGWTGKAIIAQRSDLGSLAKRDEVARTGIYLLVGPGASPSNLAVYVGEGDIVLGRISRHTKDEYSDFWEQVVVFVNASDHLTKAHIRWLEAELVKRLRGAKRAEIKNKTDPVGGTLPEAERADMETFLENIQFLLPLLGIDIFRPEARRLSIEASIPTDSPFLELRWEAASAKCVLQDGKFVVQKGSTARTMEVESLGDGSRRMRAQLLRMGVLKKSADGKLYTFAEDYAFDTISAAASVVSGTGLNGRRHWMIEGTKTSYGAWEDAQIEPTTDELDE